MTNGTLQYKSKTGGGTDPTTGDPIAVTGAWSDCIDCFIQTNHHNTKGKYIDGKFEIADYTVLIETQPFDADRVLLITDKGKTLGEFQVQNVEFLDAVGRVKITIANGH